MWFKNLDGMSRVHDKKLSILVICELLALPLESLPPVLKTLWPHLFDGLVKVFGGYENALKERKRLESGDFESDFGNAGDYAFDDNFDDDEDEGRELGEGDETLSNLVEQAATFAPKYDGVSDSDDGEWDGKT
jgi:importin-7